MSKRRRGEATKERLLDEACKVFAEKGYRDATHAEICRRAQVNAAAVNYYFVSKEALYQAAFEHLAQQADALYPLDGGLTPAAAPEERLRAFIRAHLGRMFDPERLDYLHRIRMAEMFDPTGLLAEPLARQLAQDRDHILRILRELLGPQATQREVEWCEMSVMSQCFVAAPGPGDGGPRALFKLDASTADDLAEHIMAFSLPGIAEIRRRSLSRVAARAAAGDDADGDGSGGQTA
ncbi:MAG: CerR family C-terminal domain-containing protein [Candidatus Hydrogenedentes bacterium]|nr:CerR family C-terminal domain-containing protein [Candidatus Hydrogenedentota bacterium]